ncbi:unnamed protein product [Rhizophagus irregularis]|nr:unnamed protein product [Rhizophagus irregularis]
MEENSLDLGSVKEIIVKNFENWTSGNEIINNFIQEKQLEYDIYGTVFEWIPYSELFDIKEIGNKRLAIAIWKEGPLHYDKDENKLIRKSSEKVVLRYLHNSRDDSIEEIANKVESYLKGSQGYALSRNLHRSYGLYQNSYQDYRLSQNLLRDYNPYRGYGLSQNLDTNDYILVFSNNYLDYYCGKCGNGYRKDTDDKQCIPCQISHLKNNWTSGNEIVDNFIQEKQSKYNKNDAVFEWIPYSELICIKETGDKCLTTAIWKEGPLHYDDEWIRSSYEKVVLRCLHNSRDSIVTGEIINKIKSYLEGESSQDSYIFVDSSCYGYGLSHNPDTNDYFLIFNNDYLNYYCKKCGNIYDNYNRVCKLCQINHLKNSFKNWTSKNEIIDNFIQERQLKYNETVEVFEWIPYSELFDIKEIGDKCLITAIWKEGPLHHDKNEDELIRKSYEKVVLRYLHNPRNVLTKEIINKVESYLKEFQAQSFPYGLSQDSRQGFGLSQNSDTNDYILVFSNIYLNYYCEKCGNKYEKNMYDRRCKPCQLNHLKNNFTNWTSENELIDNFIQEKQLNYNNETGAVFEWITYSELIDNKDIGDKCLTTAIWKEGPSYYDKSKNEWIRSSYKSVVLRYLHNSQDTITGEIINKIESYLKDFQAQNSSQLSQNSHQGYGLSQNSNTNDYILVFSNNYLDYYCEKCGNEYRNYIHMDNKQCIPCQILNHLKNNWTSGNEIIDNFIQKKQLKYNETGEMFEWIPYSEFIDIKEIGDKCLTTAIWKEGPLHHDKSSQNLYQVYDLYNKKPHQGYGLSQNPNTNDFILVFSNIYLDYYCEKMCSNKMIYNFDQERQLKYESYSVFEWIPYDEFIDIKGIGDNCLATAIWKGGPLSGKGMTRESYKKVGLRYLHNSQVITEEFSYEIESYLNDIQGYGLSQNPITKDYILVLNDIYFNYYCKKCGNKYEYIDNKYYIFNGTGDKWCKTCQINHLINNFTNWTSGDKKIDEFIQKMQLKINNYNDTIFEWIPYNQLINIKKMGGNFAKATWKDGPLYYDHGTRGKYKSRLSNENVLLKYLYDAHNIYNASLNEIVYSIESYGLSQNPNTKDFILVLQLKYYCEKCGEKYNNQFEIDNNDRNCISCQTKHEDKKINDLIQEMKLNINYDLLESYMMFEWIPYDQFYGIKEIGKGGFSTKIITNWKRKSKTKVALKCLHNSQNFLDEFINEVKAYSNQKLDNILKIYGISQNPNTKDYIMVLEYADGRNFNNYLDKNYERFDWINGLRVLTDIINGLSNIHLKQMVHCDFHQINIIYIIHLN